MFVMKILILAVYVLLFSGLAVAQTKTVPPPAKTVYKCVVAGKVTYSDDPCLGAVRMDVEPTRGVDKISGKSQVSSELQQKKLVEALDTATIPLTGLTTEQRDVMRRRASLTPVERSECSLIDGQVAAWERRERAAVPADLPDIQRNLFGWRKQYREKNC
jgi:hypothetical protein